MSELNDAELRRLEADYGSLLDNPSITSFTDWHFSIYSTDSTSGLDKESVLNFELEFGDTFYETFRRIVE